MPNTHSLLKAYGNIPLPSNPDMTYQEAFARGIRGSYLIRQDLMRLYERDIKTINGEDNA